MLTHLKRCSRPLWTRREGSSTCDAQAGLDILASLALVIALISERSRRAARIYSKRSAANGFSRDALRAGTTPNVMPTRTETPNAIGMAIRGTTYGT